MPHRVFDVSPLSGRIRLRDLRRFRRAHATVPRRRLWSTVVAGLGSLALSVFLGLYVTGGDLDLAPWFSLAIALLFLVAWLLVVRATGRRWRLRYRLDAFATANQLELRHDVVESARGWEVYGGGVDPKLVVQLTGHDSLGGFEVSIRARTEPTPAGNTQTVEELFLILDEVGRAGAADPASRAETTPREPAISVAVFPTALVVRFEQFLPLERPESWFAIMACRERMLEGSDPAR